MRGGVRRGVGLRTLRFPRVVAERYGGRSVANNGTGIGKFRIILFPPHHRNFGSGHDERSFWKTALSGLEGSRLATFQVRSSPFEFVVRSSCFVASADL